MSDIFEIEERALEGTEWRGTDTVEMGEEEYEYCYRNLVLPEVSKVLNTIGADRFENFMDTLMDADNDVDEDMAMRFRQLQSKKEERDLSEDEQEEYEEIMGKMQKVNLNPVDLLHPDLVEGLFMAAEMGIVGDEDDHTEFYNLTPTEQKEMYGERARKPEEAERIVDENAGKRWVQNATDQTLFNVGLNILMESYGGEGN